MTPIEDEAEGGRGSILPWLFGISLMIALIGGLAWAGVQVVPRTTSQAGSSVEPSVSLPESIAVPRAESIAVPRAEGMTFEQARAQLESLGLGVQEGDKLFSPTVPEGVVMQQNPAPGQSLSPGSVVTLILSQGPDKVPLPSFVGDKFGDAQARLEVLGLKVARTDKPTAGTPQEQVVGQDPSAGTSVAKGDTVMLLVNPGGLVPVPVVSGLTEAEAKRLIEGVGLRIPLFGINRQSRHNTNIPIAQLEAVCRGCVLSVSPPAGTALQPGTDVFLGVRDPNDSD